MDALEEGSSTLNLGSPVSSKEWMAESLHPEGPRPVVERDLLAVADRDEKSKEDNSNTEEPLLPPENVEFAPNSDSPCTSIDNTQGKTKGQCVGSLRCCSVANLLFSLLAALLTGTFPLIFHTILNYELSLQPGTNGYKMWLDSPVPIYMKFYMFNISNSQDVLNYNAKPVLKELGPFTFRELHQRVKIQHFDNDTMKFQQIRTWHFVPEMSNGSLSDNVTSLNVPLMTAAHALRNFPYLVKVLFSREMKVFGMTRFITKSVRQLLFDGYEDKLLNFSSLLPPGTFSSPNKFGWFYERNGSDYYDGVFNIFSGAGDVQKLGVMDMWNSSRHTKFYDSYCGQINGSFGEAFPPRREKSNIVLYVTDLCRSLTLDYKEEADHYGVPANRYYGSWRVFDNGTLNEDNWCYCVSGVCHPSGMVDSSPCRMGAPAFISFPHFLFGDPALVQQVEGLDPREDLHQFHIDLEPETGIPLAVAARLQISILMEPIPDIELTANITRTYLPMFWFTMSADISESLASSLKLTINLPFIGTTIFFVIFCSCLFSASVCNLLLRKRSGEFRLN